MKVLIDTNVAITCVTDRETDPYKDGCDKVMRLCADGLIEGYFAFHSVSNMWFILKSLRKIIDGERSGELLMTQKEVRNSIKDICDILTVVGASNDRISHAIDNEGFSDFEDALQAECAKTVDADYIVTGNIKDFKSSDIPAVTPDEFFEKIWVNVEF